ncbi:phenylacetate--CoA ligase family protein [Planococcus salinus]|uniref:Phenylacetate--CoA ligase family protein n=1 Tax=Planococcus salinus TaxID=1848460 RepID=A0A3M8PDP4_9BACL|nr:AMP-binding protein [Planococcus salinus]RNF41261.1 phenylacetate--CoA ligase family protein [Planococcus salinus]
MGKTGLLKAMRLTYQAGKMTRQERALLQRQRLEQLVLHAKHFSPYFSNLYSSVKGGFELTDLPPTTKAELMVHFNDWLTDRSVTEQDVNHFTDNLDNIGRKLKGRYLVNTTSGSTGNPAVVLYDETTMNVVSAIALMRAIARRQDFAAFLKKGKKTAGLFVDGGFYLGCGTVRYNQLRRPWKKDQIIVDVRQPLEVIVNQLNDFQPVMLGGYPTALELLIGEQQQGNLAISPVLIMTGGEHLSDSVREELKETFGCHVQTNYSCTEAGTIACECSEGRLHINEDWIIVEGVDADFQPVPNGQLAEKLLITNLFNWTQPFIRYELTDRAVIHGDLCKCGKTTKWLELEGRTDEILNFNNGRKVAPLTLVSLLGDIKEIQRFQLIQHSTEQLELRLLADQKQAAFELAKKTLEAYFAKQGITAEVFLSEKLPEIHPKSGKFKHIYSLSLKTM